MVIGDGDGDTDGDGDGDHYDNNINDNLPLSAGMVLAENDRHWA